MMLLYWHSSRQASEGYSSQSKAHATSAVKTLVSAAKARGKPVTPSIED